ncbi:unnamed protein product [Meloidogyne enterolobii]|uniref:Uncharacterized protein n=1 Tax=Meloidogyne enterolobii TaxID=390850 RepID=A0ACB0ZN78_MELEN
MNSPNPFIIGLNPSISSIGLNLTAFLSNSSISLLISTIFSSSKKPITVYWPSRSGLYTVAYCVK